MNHVHETAYPALPAEVGEGELRTAFTPSAAEIRFVYGQLGSLEKTENKARLAGDALSERAWATARRTLRPSGGSV